MCKLGVERAYVRSEVIGSASNPTMKDLRRLVGDKKWRQRTRRFFVEGGQITERALKSNFETDFLVVSDVFLLGDSPAHRILDEARNDGIRIVAVAESLFRSISSRDAPLGIGAVICMPERQDGTSVTERCHPFRALALEMVSNPGNLGSIIRTADAAGIGNVVLVGDCCDPYSPA